METTGITIIGSSTSPYVRKLRLFLYGHTPFEFKSIDLLNPEEQKYLQSINPISKIPVILHNEQIIFESRVIYRYLNNLVKIEKDLTIQEENTLSVIDALMDATILLFIMNRSGIPINQDLPYILKQRERIKLLMTELSKLNFSEWNFISMSLFAYLDWAQFRAMINIQDWTELNHFYQKFINAKAVQETKIPIKISSKP